MKTMLISILCMAAVSAVLAGEVTTGEIVGGGAVTSPNGAFGVAYRDGWLEFKDSASGSVIGGVEVLPPITALVWTGDSQSVVAVEHVTGGSTAKLIHFDGKAWRSRLAEPSDRDYDHVAVVGIKVGKSDVSLRYAASIRKWSAGGEEFQGYRCYLCLLEVDAATSEVTNSSSKVISERQYDQIIKSVKQASAIGSGDHLR